MYAKNALEWPFPIELWHRPFTTNKRIGRTPHAMIAAFILAGPQEDFIDEFRLDVLFKADRICYEKQIPVNAMLRFNSNLI